MSKRQIDPVEQWKAICRIGQNDRVDPDYPEVLVDEGLRRAGGDPDAIGARGEAFVAQLLAERDRASRRAASTTRLRVPARPASTPPDHVEDTTNTSPGEGRPPAKPGRQPMKEPTPDPVEQWNKLVACCDDDVLDPDYPEALVDEDLRRAGGDPDAIGKRGAALVAKLLADRAEEGSGKASRTRLRSPAKTTSSSPPAKATFSSSPPMRAKAPSDTGPLDDGE